MIEFKKGNLFGEHVDALVNSVNCVGVMGRGVALQFKKAFPENFAFYEKACRRGEVEPGKMLVFGTERLSPRWIINFPTKRHWRGASRMGDIETGLADLRAVIQAKSITSIAMPPLGSGLGGLPWDEVRERIISALESVPDVKVIVYEPSAEIKGRPVRNRPVPKMTPGRAALVGLIDRYLGVLMDPTISLLEVHKLMYFMQEAGERLRLRFVQAIYGPYAENLRHVLNEIEGHYIAGYQDGGDNPEKPLTLVAGAIRDVNDYLATNDSTREHLDRVSDLVEGFETPFGLELLATVQWLMTRQRFANASALIDATYAWHPRKRMFSPDQIVLAASTLAEDGWVEPLASLEIPAQPG